MATTKIWSTRGRADHPLEYIADASKTKSPELRSEGTGLGKVIDYATNGEKTERMYFVTGINCNETCAKKQFETVKKAFDKRDGIVAYHGYQSFAPGEATPQEAHDIGVELANRLWGENYQVLVSTHLNTDCLHNHFVVNSVSFRDGKKFHSDGKFYRRMKELSDELCREHGLSVIDEPERGGEKLHVSQKSKAGMPTRYNLTRKAIDDAISMSCNMHEFESNLRTMGFATQFSSRRKYWTVTPKGWGKPIRLMRLGEEYTNEKIFERVMQNSPAVRLKAFQRKDKGSRQYLLMIRKDRINKVGGLKGLYLRYCYELGYLPKYTQKPEKVHYLLKKDLLKCEMYTEQARLLGKYDIRTDEDLDAFICNVELEKEVLETERGKLRNAARRVMPESSIEAVKAKITSCTGDIKEKRKLLKLAEDIRKRHSEVADDLSSIEQSREKEVGRR